MDIDIDKATQREKIINWCRQNGSITVRDAFELLNINSPTKIISEIRRIGYDVKTTKEIRKQISGKTVRYTRYFISAPGA